MPQMNHNNNNNNGFIYWFWWRKLYAFIFLFLLYIYDYVVSRICLKHENVMFFRDLFAFLIPIWPKNLCVYVCLPPPFPLHFLSFLFLFFAVFIFAFIVLTIFLLYIFSKTTKNLYDIISWHLMKLNLVFYKSILNGIVWKA